MSAFALAEVPDTDIATTITTDEFTLVWMNDDVVDRISVLVVALNLARSSVPNAHGGVFRAGDHPLALAVESNAGDVVGVSLKFHDRVWIGRLDVVKAHHVSASCGEVFLVWGDA